MEPRRTRIEGAHGSARPARQPSVANMNETTSRRWAYAAAAARLTLGGGTITVSPWPRYVPYIAPRPPRKCSSRGWPVPARRRSSPGFHPRPAGSTLILASSFLLPTAYCLLPTRVFWAGESPPCSDRRTLACGSAVACSMSLARPALVAGLARRRWWGHPAPLRVGTRPSGPLTHPRESMPGILPGAPS